MKVLFLTQIKIEIIFKNYFYFDLGSKRLKINKRNFFGFKKPCELYSLLLCKTDTNFSRQVVFCMPKRPLSVLKKDSNMHVLLESYQNVQSG